MLGEAAGAFFCLGLGLLVVAVLVVPMRSCAAVAVVHRPETAQQMILEHMLLLVGYSRLRMHHFQWSLSAGAALILSRSLN